MGGHEAYEQTEKPKKNVIFLGTGARLPGYGPVVGVLDEFIYGMKALTPMLLFTLVTLNKPSLRRAARNADTHSASSSSPHYALVSSSLVASLSRESWARQHRHEATSR